MIPQCERDLTKRIEELGLNKISKCTTIKGVDVDTINDTQINYCNACTNLPAGSGNGYLITIKYVDTYMMQKFFRRADRKEYTRYKENGTWGEWDPATGIVESGSNENGYYIKFSDGTLICTLNKVLTNFAVDKNYGNSPLFQNKYVWNFPEQFTSIPAVSIGQFQWGTGVSWGTVTGVDKNVANLTCLDCFSRPASESTNVRLSAIAIGSWK